MSTQTKNPEKSPGSSLFERLAGVVGRTSFGQAVARSLPHYFLQGKDAPYSGSQTSVTDAYEQSTWVYAALRTIAQPLRAARLVWLDDAGEPVEDDALARFWKTPARGVHEPLGRGDLIEQSLTIRGIAGGFFWILDDSWMYRSTGLRNPIILATRSQMTPIYDGRVLDGWIYRGGGKMLTLAREQVIHCRYPNPGDPESLDGIAPWMPARPSAEAARAGQIFARRIMDRNGDMGKIFISRTPLTQAQQDMARAELNEKRRAADLGKHRDVFFGGDIEVKESPLATINADFAKQLEMSRDEIYVAYGVPPSMASQTASYSVGAASDWYRLITGTCAAEGEVIAAAIARVSEYFLGIRDLAAEIQGRRSNPEGLSLACEFDFSNHPVMADIRAARVEQLKNTTLIGMPVSVANEWMGLGIPEYAGWDQRLLPISVSPVEAGVTGQESRAKGTSANLGSKALDGIEDDIARLFAKKSANLKKKQSAERAALWARVDRAREGDRKRIAKIVGRHLMSARSETIKNLEAQYATAKSIDRGNEFAVRSGVLEIVFDLTRWVEGLWKDLSRAIGGIYVTAGEQAAEDLGEDAPAGTFDPLKETDPEVIDKIRDRENLIKGASDAMHAEVVASLEEGLQAGETLDQLTARVRAVFNDIDKVRAQTIARTETGAAYETARYMTFKRGGITQKGWLSGGDDGHTRDTHMAADGQRRGIDELFEVGAARLLHPHDQVGGKDHPEELINCRCVLTAEG